MVVLGQAFAWVEAMSATSSRDQETENASRDESNFSHTGRGLDSPREEIRFAESLRLMTVEEARTFLLAPQEIPRL
jgi:hypothetical protein